MSNEISILAVAGAIEKDKFKTTVSKVSPGGREVVYQADHNGISVKEMAMTMRDLVKGVLRAQQQVNQVSGINSPVPIIMGWERGEFFRSLDESLRLHPNPDLQSQFYRERDKGVLISAVDNASKELGLGAKTYLARYSNVQTVRPSGDLDLEIAPEVEARYANLINEASDKDGGNDALNELRREKFYEGRSIVMNSERDLGRKLKAPNDMDDSRFVLVYSAGPNEKTLMQRWDLRNWFAAGYKYQAGIKPDHVLCVKEGDVDTKERPLQNVAEATAYQLLINDGFMRLEDLEAPYV